MPLTVDVSAPLGLSLDETTRLAQLAEALGFAGTGIADHLDAGPDPFLAIAHAAASTSRIVLYPSVTNPVTRHPLVLAALTKTLNEMAPGRIKLGIGPGDGGVRPAGHRPATVAEMRSAILAIRQALLGLQGPPPLMLAASGPRMTELAGELADEALLMAGLDQRMLARAQGLLEAGAHRSGRPLDELRVSHFALISIDEDMALAQERARPWLHRWLLQGQLDAALHAVEMEVPQPARAQDIPQELLAQLFDLLFVVGTPEGCVQRLRQMAGQGVEQIMCMFPGGADVTRRGMETLAGQVLPQV